MIEKVNQIRLDLTNYSGLDLYSDGAVEDEMLEMVQQHDESELNGLVRDNFSWPFLYHFSRIRQNIVTWLPITKEHNVLEIGAGCGAITGALADMADHVTCIELSKKRSLINANRNKKHDNIEIKVGNFTDIEPKLTEKYDYITLIGVYEYAESYIKSDNPYVDFLNCIRKHLKPDGRIVIAIENRIGMKYIAGCREDHTSIIGEGLNHYPLTTGVKTFDKRELSQLFEKCGFDNFSFFYPYPDYKLPYEIYSDKWLPEKGMLTQNINNLDQSRIRCFDESKAFDKSVELKIFDEISNSFEVILENNNKKNEAGMSKDSCHAIYTKFSNDRASKYAILTKILEKSDGELRVCKLSADNAAAGHIEHIFESYTILQNIYSESRFFPNHVQKENGQLFFEFINGMTLDKELDTLLFNDRPQEFYSLLDDFVKEVKKVSQQYYNIDLIPSNIIVSNDQWNVIDYEWTYKVAELPEPMRNPDFLVYRILHYYLDVSERRQQYLNTADFFSHFGFSEEKTYKYGKIEEEFQCWLDGDYYKLMTAKNEHHKRITDINNVIIGGESAPWDICIKVFYEDGQEEFLFHPEEYDEHKTYIGLKLYRPFKQARIYRSGKKCIMGISRMQLEGKNESVEFNMTFFKDVLIKNEQVFLEENEYLTIQPDSFDWKEAPVVLKIYFEETVLNDTLNHVLDLKNKEIAQQKEYMVGLKENIRRLEEMVQIMKNSSSWKITKPLRGLGQVIHGEKND